MIPIVAEVAKRDRDAQLLLYRIVAETIRARLDPPDSAIVAAWFDRLGAGEAPEKVFTALRGRPRGRTKPRTLLRGRMPDDIDVAWLVKRHIEANVLRKDAERAVAKLCGMEPGSVKNIYDKHRDEIPDRPP